MLSEGHGATSCLSVGSAKRLATQCMNVSKSCVASIAVEHHRRKHEDCAREELLQAPATQLLDKLVGASAQLPSY